MRVVITGTAGFIGRYLTPYLTQKHDMNILHLRRITRNDGSQEVGLTAHNHDIILQLKHNADCLIHLAARAHAKSTAEDFQRDNIELSKRIGEICVAAEIPRLIYISSIKVNGNSTTNRGAYNADETPNPEDTYGHSKLACEQLLQQITAGSKTQLIIIRPPLVYGENNKGNLATLARWANKGIPLPFNRINNKRDLVSLENLCSLIDVCIKHPAALGHIFLVSDGISRNTAEILALIMNDNRKSYKTISIPLGLFSLLKKITPFKQHIESLTGNLEVDITKTKTLLGWNPHL